MKKMLPLIALMSALATPVFAQAPAAEIQAGDLVITQPWSRATPTGAKVGAGYLTIRNSGQQPDRLIGVTMPPAGRVEVHEMAEKDGVMTMRPMSGGVTIAPGQTVTLAPGGIHLMLLDLKAPITRGEQLQGVLEFEKAGKVTVPFVAEAVGAPRPSATH